MGHSNLIYPTKNLDLLAKMQRNRFIITFQLSQEQDKELMPLSHISIEIAINGIFHRNSIFAYFDDPWYRRKSLGITKYGTIEMDSIVKKEDLVESFFFVPEEVHILPRSSSIMVRNNSIIGADTQITSNIRSQVGRVLQVDREKKDWTSNFSWRYIFFLGRHIRYPDTAAFWCHKERQNPRNQKNLKMGSMSNGSPLPRNKTWPAVT